MPESNIIKVSQLNNVIKNIFYAEEMLHNIVIMGEISGFKISGQHAYFALKDEESAIQCNCFNYQKTYIPKEGEQILAKGSVDYYTKIGRLNFNITQIQPYGAGALAAMLEKLKKELAEKGYFDIAHKQPIPKFPKRVCVITSKTGAVIRDIITTIRKVNDLIDIVVKDVKVQGIGAEDDIAQAIKQVDDLGFDVLIVARGGGSLEDLMPFNSEKIVYAIYNAKTPIISSVGHETDTTLCDLAADIRVPTPTAAGELVGYNVEEYKNYIQDLGNRLSSQLSACLDHAKTKLDLQMQRIIGAFNGVYSKNSNKLELYSAKIGLLANNILKNKEHEFGNLSVRLDAVNPLKVFSRSYLYAQKDGQNITSIEDIKVKDKIEITTKGGKAKAEIIEVNKL
ncbi:MAG: exodeoxyribonuclease VII large subunit [Clostridiales bacterium]|nr:exodeoxyribonuclease VII large subunit [Clostridiales bacterium]